MNLYDALEATGLIEARVHHKPRLLSDNGPCYISKELREWLLNQDMKHTRGAPYHPMTPGKIERLPSIHEERGQAGALLLPLGTGECHH